MQDFDGDLKATRGEEITVGTAPGKGDWFLLTGREASLACVLARGWETCGSAIDWGVQYLCDYRRCDRRERSGEAARVPPGEQNVAYEEPYAVPP